MFTDTFNRANNADIGAAYTASYTGFISGQIFSQRVVASAVGPSAVEQYTGVPTPNDQWSEVTIGALASGVVAQVGAQVRMTNPTNFSGYRCFAAVNQTNKAGIRRFDAGISNALASDTTTAWGVGDKLRCEIQGATIKLYRVVGTAETLVLSATDATYTSGTTGLYAFVAAGGTVTDGQISAFSLGGFGTTSLPPTTSTTTTSSTTTGTSTTTAPSTPITSTSTLPSTPSTPTTSLPSAPTSRSAILSWTLGSASDLAGYKVYVGTSSGTYNYPGSPFTIGVTTTYSISNLPPGQTYFFALSAYDTSGNNSALSAEVSKSIY
ncbi:MAG TPA: fibronectin type III domain-containing protein [Nitrospira sp.]